MKNKTIGLMLLLLSGLLLQGCIAFPPLIQVEHKDAPPDSNKEILRRLDSIDQRLNQLEQKQDKK
jgi:starvation-inducible outer membrane lipoprotein